MKNTKIKYSILTNNIFKGDNKYYYFYVITHSKSGKKYFGVHSTHKLDDGYAGSGKALRKEMKYNNIDEYHKDIIKFFKTSDEMYAYEKAHVTKEIALNNNFYNLHSGGDESWDFTIGKTCVKNKDGKHMLVDVNDPRIKSGELVSNMKGLVHVIDNNEQHLTITTEEYYKNKNLYKAHTAGKVVAKVNGKTMWVDKKEFDEQSQQECICGHTKGCGVFKDKHGNGIMCKIDDPRVLSGELVGYTKGFTIYKYKNDFSKTCITTKDDPRVLSGELVGINYGIVYCINTKTGEKIKALKDDPRLQSGEIISINKLNNLKRRKAI